MRRLWR